MFKGGYQILNLNGTAIAEGGTVFPGIYKKISETDGKAYLFSGINLGSGVIKDRFVSLDIEDTSFFGVLDSTRMIYVDADDTVTVEAISSEIPLATSSTIGGMYVSDVGTTVPQGGVVSLNSSGKAYVPTASSSIRGCVRVGAGLTIDTNGILSVSTELLKAVK